ncbi:MAG TPA: crosslink repair DNA glycosylase YcaQ family protein, partial [Dehalococcoidia bacterium]|nr:crosslink repair DNA glycosylase YcaQ family protein [Dehalococcoidia bacterium]
MTAQGLTTQRPASPGRDDVLAAIRRMHALQIDTISVVARSPYLVLWSRLGDYEPKLLDQLLTDRAIFEHWSHAACFLDIGDYPLYRRMMLDSQVHWLARYKAWFEVNDGLVEDVL